MKGLEEIHNIKTMVNKTALYSFAKREDFIKACNVVENELKALEILRQHKEAINEELLWYKSKKQEYELVKEVLEND